jgi:hypothetical protein
MEDKLLTEGTERENELQRQHRQVGFVAKCVTATLTSAAAYYTWNGISAIEGAADWHGKSAAALFSVSLAVGVYSVWRSGLGYLPAFSGWRRLAGVVVIVVGALMSVSITSFFNLTGMVGQDVQKLTLSAENKQFGDVMLVAQRRAEANLDRGSSFIQSKQAQFEMLAKAERDGVGPSGTGGDGAVLIATLQVANAWKVASGQSEKLEAEKNELVKEAQRHLADMQTILNSAGPIEGKIVPLMAEAEKLRVCLVKLSQLALFSVIRAADATLRWTPIVRQPEPCFKV